MKSAAFAFVLAAAALAGLPALAGAPVALRDHPTSHGASVTLGDLFEGAGVAAGVVVAEAAPDGGEAVLEAGRVQMAARRAGLDWDNAVGQRRVIVASSAAPHPSAAATRAPARAHAAAHSLGGVLVYARSINAGEIITASDLVWSNEAVAPADAPADAEAAIGKSARRPLREGAAVGARDLSSPRLIRRDEMVNVAFDEGGVRLVLQAKALGDAAQGDVVQLVNLNSKKLLQAVATGPGEAVIGAEAEAVKAAALNPALRFAAR